jgi:hypothetical protein
MIPPYSPAGRPAMPFFEELKRRNVVKVAVLYWMAAWLILQVADVVFAALELPAAWMRLVVAILVLGFPVILILRAHQRAAYRRDEGRSFVGGQYLRPRTHHRQHLRHPERDLDRDCPGAENHPVARRAPAVTPTDNLPALEAYFLGRQALVKRTSTSRRKPREAYQQRIVTKPTSCAASSSPLRIPANTD